ncbi:site-specific DNA-methyltransferase [Glaesserella parasuis]|uniref:site-specific DNA-methyltransferase (adenine-specific) n=2 Tax=Glaesserella parasuis TaxID=738 RepID=A0A859IIX2_GLAPU|nr:site-specific DNA-methyltransferase [Glaesserella parasuis]
MHTENLVAKNIEKLTALFPNCITEMRNEQGEIIKGVDFDLLRQELSEVLVEGNQERYRLDWVGKKQAILAANEPIAKTLRPCREESVNFDTTQNLFIEGDNLDALKLLQETYLGKVKMIYIDPPYNTGNDFIYNDDFAENYNDFLARSNQIDEEGNRLTANTESNGRFHSDWLSMMYSRLKLARNLLSDDGVIFISIDDNEQANLKRICDEVFGENNLINNISIKMSELSGVKMKHMKKYPKIKEFLLIYAKDSNISELIIEKRQKNKETLENYLKYYSYFIENIQDRCEDWIITPISKHIDVSRKSEKEFNDWKIENAYRVIYRTNSKTIDKYLKENPNSPKICKIINNDGKEVYKWENKEMLFLEKYIEEYIGDIWLDISTINLNKENESIPFENGQKPLALLKRILQSINTQNSIILDFFAGSGTTAHAVNLQNSIDGGNRKYILVQLPEKLSEKVDSQKESYKFCIDNNLKPLVSEISKERIRRAGNRIIAEQTDRIGSDRQDYALINSTPQLDIGFRVLKIDSTNMKDVYYTPDKLSQSLLDQMTSHIKEDRSAEDLLFQVMLDWGIELSLSITRKTIDNATIYFVGENSLVACFDPLTPEIINVIAQAMPLRVVSCESAIIADHDKTNIKERFKQLSPDTEVRFL